MGLRLGVRRLFPWGYGVRVPIRHSEQRSTSFQVAFEVTTLEGISAKRWGRFLQGHMEKMYGQVVFATIRTTEITSQKGQTHFPMYLYVEHQSRLVFGWILSTLAVHLSKFWKDIAKTTWEMLGFRMFDFKTSQFLVSQGTFMQGVCACCLA